MRVVTGSDHAGFELKEAMKAFLIDEHHEVVDVGTHSLDPVDYPDYAIAVAAAVRGNQADRGILMCGSGVGAAMAANRIPGIRAGLCHDTYSAHQGVEHDDMNVLVLGGRVVGVELARELIRAFLGARFTGESRYVRRLAKVTALENPLRALNVYGQSVWLDYIRRSLITSGDLRRLIGEDGLRGLTSNPTIFEKAVTGSPDYKDFFDTPDARRLDAKTLYEKLVVRDIQDVADALRSVYDTTAKRDGYVSLEVSPLAAYDTAATLEEARRLWQAVARDNLMIKVPATAEGIPAIRQLIGDGINVNVTLLFSQAAYEQVANAYISGLEDFRARKGDLSRIASVASFFVSRIDTAIDALTAARLQTTASAQERSVLQSLGGKVAIANARLAYQRYKALFSGPRWKALADQGAQTQRLLWASTSTKNPRYRDVMYVEELIGPDTVNTMPPATVEAFRHHGQPRASLLEDVGPALATMSALADVNLSMKEVTDRLLAEGVQLFAEAFKKLLEAVRLKTVDAGGTRINGLTYVAPKPMAEAVSKSLDEWRAQNRIRRLWSRDASLWTGKDEAQWLGWLGVTNGQLAHIERFRQVAEIVRTAGFSHAVLLGMGGSSLCPDVLASTFGRIEGWPALHVLDSTDPAQIRSLEQAIDLKKTFFIVSSKSGSTLEPEIFRQYFFNRVREVVGSVEAGKRFIAITDPGSMLQQTAERDGFRHVFFGWPDIGGRYSALSDFGLVPAAVMGIDVAKFLDRTEAMVCACMPSVPVEENPGVMLGTVLGVAATSFGRDKVTIVASPGIRLVGAWLEQLIAESTGKVGKGLIPIDREEPGPPAVYGPDRIFVYLKLQSAPDETQDRAMDALQRAGHPVVRITVDDPYDLGEEFFRWEIAIAVAGSIVGINPFDQPDVEASKIATRKLTAEYEKSGSLPAETPILTADAITLFTDDVNSKALSSLVGSDRTLEGLLRAHLGRAGAGDYVALLAYIEMNDPHDRILQSMRHAIRDARRVATCVEFGPRFLHSTGQAYKGGPNSGVFIQITCDDAADLPVPGRKYTFGVVKAAQALGDFQVLAERNRPALRVHIGGDLRGGLVKLQTAVQAALRS